jgi:hypothetical protein
MTAIKIFVLSFFSLFVMFSLVSPAVQAKSAGDCGRTFFGIPYWYKYLDFDEDCNIKTKDQENVPAKIILGIIDIALFLAGLLAVIMIMWGGFQFIFANGEPGSIANARKTILNAVIGLVIAILASQIVRFVALLLSRPA